MPVLHGPPVVAGDLHGDRPRYLEGALPPLSSRGPGEPGRRGSCQGHHPDGLPECQDRYWVSPRGRGGCFDHDDGDLDNDDHDDEDGDDDE